MSAIDVSAPVTRAQRMKEYEDVYRTVIPGKQYVVIRADGRSFRTLTRGMEKPFDHDLMTAMNHVAQVLCAEIQGAQFAYTQSDEVSVLVTDFGSNAEPWFGGVVQNMASIAASAATMAFNGKIVGHPANAMFDARVFTLPSREEVINYFLWRQADCWRNAISMIAEANFPSKQLLGLKADQRVLLLDMHGIYVDRFPQEARYGRVTTRELFQEKVTYTRKDTGETLTQDAIRSRWVTTAAPLLREDDFLQLHVPLLPEGDTDA